MYAENGCGLTIIASGVSRNIIVISSASNPGHCRMCVWDEDKNY